MFKTPKQMGIDLPQVLEICLAIVKMVKLKFGQVFGLELKNVMSNT